MRLKSSRVSDDDESRRRRRRRSSSALSCLASSTATRVERSPITNSSCRTQLQFVALRTICTPTTRFQLRRHRMLPVRLRLSTHYSVAVTYSENYALYSTETSFAHSFVLFVYQLFRHYFASFSQLLGVLFVKACSVVNNA